MMVPSTEELSLLHRNMCQALGDPTRLQIFYILNEQPRNVTALTSVLGISQPTVSRHLRVLRQRAMVKCERDGSSTIYRLSDPAIIDILDDMRHLLRNIVEQQSNILMH